jgi:hypothetical protein
MLGGIFTVTINSVGALGESKDYYFTAPFDMTLYHVSMCNLTNGTTSVQLKNTTDSTDLTDDDAVGEGSTPTEINLDDMNGDQYPHIDKGDVVHFDIDDTDGDDVLIVATFLVG